jgi:hypothetical protein
MNNETGNITIIVPMLNFDCENDKIKLNETLMIRRFSSFELESLMKHTPEYYNYLKNTVGNAKFVVEKRINLEKTKSYWLSDISHDTEKIGMGLRLLGLGPVKMPIAFRLTEDSLYVEDFLPKLKYFFEDRQYVLSKQQILEFKIIWKALRKVEKKKPHLEFALSQFNKSFEDSNEETFIDYVTAFESIVFGRGKNAPYPYGRSIGIAIGMLIGKNEKERTDIERMLNDAYEVRNKVVHGHLRHKLENQNDDAISKLLDYTQECLIKSLRKLLEEK